MFGRNKIKEAINFLLRHNKEDIECESMVVVDNWNIYEITDIKFIYDGIVKTARVEKALNVLDIDNKFDERYATIHATSNLTEYYFMLDKELCTVVDVTSIFKKQKKQKGNVETKPKRKYTKRKTNDRLNSKLETKKEKK